MHPSNKSISRRGLNITDIAAFEFNNIFIKLIQNINHTQNDFIVLYIYMKNQFYKLQASYSTTHILFQAASCKNPKLLRKFQELPDVSCIVEILDGV